MRARCELGPGRRAGRTGVGFGAIKKCIYVRIIEWRRNSRLYLGVSLSEVICTEPPATWYAMVGPVIYALTGPAIYALTGPVIFAMTGLVFVRIGQSCPRLET